MWYGEINITSFHRLQVWFYCEQIIPISFQNLNWSSLIKSYIYNMFLAEFPVLVNGVSAVFTQFIIEQIGNSSFGFLRIYIWSFHMFTKSSLCVGDLLRHHTPHLRLTNIRWPVPYKGWCPLASLSEARWMVEGGCV